jgi:DNA polymerase-3 subunit delta
MRSGLCVKPAEVRKQIASGDTAPLYLLSGDDPQSRHDMALEFVALVDEGLQAFNVQTFFASEATSVAARDQLIGQMLAAARTLPMMAPRRVLILHAAEKLLSPRKGGDDAETPPPPLPGTKRKRALTPTEELEAYLANPEPLTTLVFVAGGLDGNRRLVKLVRSHAVSVDCGSPSNAAEAMRWIKTRLDTESLPIEPEAARLIVDYATHWDPKERRDRPDLLRLRQAIDKLALFCADDRVVTQQHVREVILPELDPGNFALGMAVQNGDLGAALRELRALADAGSSEVMMLGQIRAGVSGSADKRSHEWIRQALDAVFETDLAIKSSGIEPRFILERLVIDICGRGGATRPGGR